MAENITVINKKETLEAAATLIAGRVKMQIVVRGGLGFNPRISQRRGLVFDPPISRRRGLQFKRRINLDIGMRVKLCIVAKKRAGSDTLPLKGRTTVG